MATVNDNDAQPKTPDVSFQCLPSQTIGCVTTRCTTYRSAKQSELVFWDGDAPHAHLHCRRCEEHNAPTDMYRRQGSWNNPYHGLLIALASGIIIWFLPHKLLPWSQTAKIAISVLCAMTVISIVMQLQRRSKRMLAFGLFARIGEPANLPQPPELSLKLLEDLQGKVASLDGKLKSALHDLIAALRQRTFPALMQLQCAIEQLERSPLAELQALQQRAQLSPEEQQWVTARLQWLQRATDDKAQHLQDVGLVRDLFDSISDNLESLKYGDGEEKEEARANLKHHLDEGNELNQRLLDTTR